MRSWWRALRTAFGRDNPFLLLALRQIRRHGDAGGWWPPLLLVAGSVAVWQGLAALEEFTRLPAGRWHPLLGWQSLIVALAAGVAAARMLPEVDEEGNTTDLRMTRLRPAELLLAKAVPPMLSAFRVALCATPVLLALRTLPSRGAPTLLGVLVILLAVAFYALLMAAGAGAAAVRSRRAAAQQWGNLLFNLRTLTPLFLNPLWVFTLCVAAGAHGPRLAGWLCGLRPWFGWRLHPAVWLLVYAPWAARHLSGLAVWLYGETVGLSRRITLLAATYYAGGVLLLSGFGWQAGLVGHGLLRDWDFTPALGFHLDAQLLLALCLWLALPLLYSAIGTATLAAGLRGDVGDPPERLPAPAGALAKVAGVTLVAAAWPWLVYGLVMRLGGWALTTAGPDYLRRTAWLWFTAALLLSGYLTVLALLPRLLGTVRDLCTVTVALLPLTTPLLFGQPNPRAQLGAVLSPLTGWLALFPRVGQGDGMLGELGLKLSWPAIAVGGGITWAGLLLLATGFILWERRTGGPARQPKAIIGAEVWRRMQNPALGLDLLRLHRRGALLSPLVMPAMPILAQAYSRLDPALAELVRETCSLFLWHADVAPLGGPVARFLPLVFGTIGLQLILLPTGFAASRSFARERAAGRLEPLWVTTLGDRTILWGRYLSSLAPVAVFLAVFSPLLLWTGWRFGEWPQVIGGLLHWYGLFVAVPALVLAETVDRDWRGQGLGTIVGLELARLVLIRRICSAVPAEAGVPAVGFGMALAYGLIARSALARCETTLAARRVGIEEEPETAAPNL